MSVMPPAEPATVDPPGDGSRGDARGAPPVTDHPGLHPRGEYVPVPLAALRLADRYPFDLYSREIIDGRARFVLFRTRRLAMPARLLERLAANRIRFLYLRTADHRFYTRFLESRLDQAMGDPDLADREKARILYTTAVRLLDEIFADPGSLDELRRTVPIVRHISRRVLADPRPLATMAAMNAHDHYTTTHMVNVAGYLTALAVVAGVGDPAELEQITLGGLLHDLGKITVSPEILNKPGKLTDAEWAAVRQHPARSLSLASGTVPIGTAAGRIMVEHHERMDGTGYPRRLPGDRIHRYARMASICDVFDALTSHRMYRQVLTAEKALGEMESMVGSHFDGRWFGIFRKLVVGTLDARSWPPAAVRTRAGTVPATVRAAGAAQAPAANALPGLEVERRTHPRRPAPMNVRIDQLVPGSTEVAASGHGRLLDLSRSGVRVFSPVPLPAGTGVRVVPPGGLGLRRDLIAEVIRSQADPASGGCVAGLRFRMAASPAGPPGPAAAAKS